MIYSDFSSVLCITFAFNYFIPSLYRALDLPNTLITELNGHKERLNKG